MKKLFLAVIIFPVFFSINSSANNCDNKEQERILSNLFNGTFKEGNLSPLMRKCYSLSIIKFIKKAFVNDISPLTPDELNLINTISLSPLFK